MSKQPSNIDILSVGNPCNQNCQQCYYVEKKIPTLNIDQETAITRIAAKYRQSAIYIYPKEIANNQQLFALLGRVGQQTVLSNGTLLTAAILKSLKSNGVKEIKITFFATAKEQKFFNGNNASQYNKIISAIKMCRQHGFIVTVNNVLSKINIRSINLLCKTCHELKVNKIEFLRLKPLGNGEGLNDLLLDSQDVENIIIAVEKNKKLYPNLYLSFNLSFGPNFYGKSLKEARAKVSKATTSWTKSRYLCPAIGGNYCGVSVATGKVYWCFFAMNQKAAEAGHYDVARNKIITDNYPDLSVKKLTKKLRGNCSSNKCVYSRVCLGGCRSTAYVFAKNRGERDPLYAGMDICLTSCYENITKKTLTK